MGLLDDLTYDPQMALGLGLLSAGGNSRMPVSLGQGLGSAWSNMQNTAKEGLQSKMGNLQLQALQQQIAQAAQKNDILNGILKRFQGGQAQSPIAPSGPTPPGISADSLAAFGLPPSMATPEQPAQPIRSSSGFPLSFQDVVALKLAGGPDLAADFKMGSEGFEKKPGSFYDSPLTGKREYVADPTKGITIGSDGKVIAMSGAAAALAGIEGAKTGAQKAAESRYTMGTYQMPDGKGGYRQVTLPLNVALNIANGSAPSNEDAQAAVAAGTANGIPASVTGPRPASSKFPFAGPTTSEQTTQEANKTFQVKSMENAAEYEKGLNEKVAAGAELARRVGEQAKLLDEFQTGASGPIRAKVSAWARDLGAGEELVTRLGRGDPAAAQEFQKFAAQTNLEQLKQAIGANRMLKTEFDAFEKANPSIATDPKAVKKVFDWLKDTYMGDYAQQQALRDFKKSGGDPSEFQSEWAYKRVTGEADQLKTMYSYGYKSKDAALKDAKNTLMQNPSARAEINRRLQLMGIDPIGAK